MVESAICERSVTVAQFGRALQEVCPSLWPDQSSVDRVAQERSVFRWTSAHEESFTALKGALTSAPVLALPNFSKPFVVETDASNKGIGAVLMQDQHPIAFLSQTLGPWLRTLLAYERDNLYVLMVVEHWCSYLQTS